MRIICPKCLFDMLVPLSFCGSSILYWQLSSLKVLRGSLLIGLKKFVLDDSLRFCLEIHPSAPFLLIEAQVSSCSHFPELGSLRPNWTMHLYQDYAEIDCWIASVEWPWFYPPSYFDFRISLIRRGFFGFDVVVIILAISNDDSTNFVWCSLFMTHFATVFSFAAKVSDSTWKK